MTRRDAEFPAESPDGPHGRVRAYLTRFLTSWVAEDPSPTYSPLDRADGLDQYPDPVCHPRVQVPESAEVAGQVQMGDEHVGAFAPGLSRGHAGE